MHKSEDLALEIAKSRQSLFEIIGIVRISFSNTPELEQLTEKVYHFKFPAILKRPFDLKDKDQLEVYQVKAIKEIQDIVDREFAQPVDELLTYLERQLRQERQ